MKYLAKYIGNTFKPCYNSDDDKLKASKLMQGETYEIEIRKSRNIKFHRKYFALLNMTLENQEIFNNLEELRYYLIMKAGYYKKVDTGTGIMYYPKSISFANMDQIEFDELYSKTIDVIISFLHITEDTINEELINFM